MTYKLVIAEKPSVARSIAGVIGAKEKHDGYLEGNGYLVSWCIGHLVSFADAGRYDERFKKWRYEDLPILPETWQYIIPDDKKQQFDVLRSLMQRPDVTGLVCATDAGREGELIFRFVYQMAGCQKPFDRLWISSMEDSAIKEGFAHLKPGTDYDPLYQSALCRAKADWLIGINATRLFSVLYHKTLTVGRVQTPTLKMLVDRDAKITDFKKEKYHIVHIAAGGADAVSSRFPDAAEANTVKAACAGAQAVCASVTREKKTEQPPKLYDLTTLQREANRLFGYTAKQTLDYAQTLYEKKLLTYPRTDSQYLTDDMLPTAESLVSGLWGLVPFAKGLNLSPQFDRILNSKKVSDHHAIIPTAEFVKQGFGTLAESEKKLLSLICCKLLCAVAGPHVYEAVTATFTCAGKEFTAKGKTVLSPGWKEIERRFRSSLKTDADEEAEAVRELPELCEGQTFTDVAASVTEHFTTPPKPYTEDTLLSAMERAGAEDMPEDAERKGLGTPATRAAILEKLVQMGFVQRKGKQAIENRRFMYQPQTGTLILGYQFHGKDLVSSHAEEYHASGAQEPFDSFIRGWIGTGRSYPDGVIHFAPNIDSRNTEQFDRAFSTLEMFRENNANGKTVIRGFGDRWERPFSEIIPKKERSDRVNEVFSIQVHNRQFFEQGKQGVWLDLPTTTEKLQAALRDVGITADNPQDFFINGYSCPEDRHLAIPYDMVLAADVDELNFLAVRLGQLDAAEIAELNAALQNPRGGFESIGQIIDYTENVDYYVHLPDVMGDGQLGDYYLNRSGMVDMPQEWKAGIDTVQFGRHIAQQEQGVFTQYGYLVRSGDEWQRVHEGQPVPEEYRVMAYPQPEVLRDETQTRQAEASTAEAPAQPQVIPIILNSKNSADRMKEITDRLETGIMDLFESGRYQAYRGGRKPDLYVPQRRPAQNDKQAHRRPAGYGRGYAGAGPEDTF